MPSLGTFSPSTAGAKIVEHAALDEYCRRVTTDNGYSASMLSTPNHQREASTAEAERILKTVTARLPPKDAELVTLRFLEGLSVRQVAQRMSCSEDAVRKRIRKLRAILRRPTGNDMMQQWLDWQKCREDFFGPKYFPGRDLRRAPQNSPHFLGPFCLLDHTYICESDNVPKPRTGGKNEEVEPNARTWRYGCCFSRRPGSCDLG